MKANQVHNMKDDELVAKSPGACSCESCKGELENTAGIGGSRRDVARLMTVAKERGIDLEKELRH